MDIITQEKVYRMLGGHTVIMSDEQFDQIIGLRVTNYVRSLRNSDQIGTKDQWKCWIAPTSLKKANGDFPFLKD